MIFVDQFNKLAHSFYNLVVLKTKLFSKERKLNFFLRKLPKYLLELKYQGNTSGVCVCVSTYDNIFFFMNETLCYNAVGIEQDMT